MNKIKIFSLGGLNEIGKNMYIVEVNDDIFVFDAGLKYADDKMLGIDYVIPNYDYLKINEKRIKGIFITHGHDEQMGALCDILADLKNVKVYGTTFTIALIREELKEEGITANLVEIEPHKKVKFGVNSIFPISLTHTVPDAVGYVLYTPDGAIFYTGNFMFDPTMIGPYKTDIGKLAYVGKQGVLCLLSESLYADKRGFTSPNHRTSDLMRAILDNNQGRILYNIYQAQLYRIQELLNEVDKTDRKVVIMGKRLQSMIEKAIEMKYLKFNKRKLLSIHHVNDEGIVVVISDEREKPFSNLQRIIKGFDKFITISDKDTVVFASPVYDGMEKTATKMFDRIAQIGANLINLPMNKYLSHHASSEDLMMMIDLLNPKYYFPVIGEYRHQVENAKAAEQIGINPKNILLKLNGEVATFEDGQLVETGEKVKIDDILIDGKTVGDIGELVIKDRELLCDNGIVIITVTIDKKTKQVLAGPEVLTRGFIYVKDNIDLIKEAERLSLEIIKDNTKPLFVDFAKVKSGIRDKVGKYFYQQTECRPMIIVVMGEV